MYNDQTKCAHLSISADGGVSGIHLYDPNSGYGRGGSTEYRTHNLQRVLPDLAEGGYVIDKRPLAEHPQFSTWVMRAPLPNGDIEGEFIQRLPEEVRTSASQLSLFMSGDFQTVGFMMAHSVGEPKDGSAGPFGHVSSAYLARYWEERGARIGKRKGNTLYWNDGMEEEIPTSS